MKDILNINMLITSVKNDLLIQLFKVKFDIVSRINEVYLTLKLQSH
jgi:hypothetical protein